jgi:undecaprenyl-diphosphatase
MDLHSFLQAVVLGIVEGVTEFLPISSTGHLILVGQLLGFEGAAGKTFDIVIQLGAILAVVWIYRDLLWKTLISLTRDREAWHLARNVVLAFLPAAIIGVLAQGFITRVLFNSWIVCTSFILGGIAIIVIERTHQTPRIRSSAEIPPGRALTIGVFQCIAMIPGVSRSGATIMGALLAGVDRRTAAEFSFFLAIPTMFGATVYQLYKNRHDLSFDGAELIAVGFVVSFAAALVVVRWLLRYISGHRFTAFAVYRIVVGVLGLGLAAAGIVKF